MKVLFTVSECVPFVKSGGLADVAGALPKELRSLGTDIRVILPKYGGIPHGFLSRMKKKKEFFVSVGWRNQYCGIEELQHDGVTYYFVDNEYYFNRDRMYGYFDDGERFSFFTRAVLESMEALDFYPDVIHCHDWHTAMVPFLLKTEYQGRPGYEFIRSVFTIHNLQFQGIFPKGVMTDLLGIPDHYFHPEYLEFYGNINFMKGALLSSDFITTVSPTYKDEILTPYYGEKLHGVLRQRTNQLQGILNGIDDEVYNPEEGPIPFRSGNLEGKTKTKLGLQEKLNLEVNENIPMVSIISRLTVQKGLELVRGIFHEMIQENVQFVLLGTGDWEFEQFFREMESQYPDKVRVKIGFSEELAKEIYAASDLFLMPSKFEPCGLGQLIAMRYGVLPIVRETGGLNDTVQSYDEVSKAGNGFSFKNFNAHDMLYTYRRALDFYHHDRETWKHIVQTAMNKDYSWAQSAFKYNQLYADLVSRSESHVF
ncbi:glycogen synthase GlgA [Rossellomorea aquimaris]|uniref:glycogen synthase GlgA n=1 Tax=Rossellomorea aquimaris TaxID=189382 RepID=UPI001CD809EA|nr:glycogen synthase GlgA [Rossellomorea aquimaris]MCA1056785.1 glycogen synthase GlgA [Rossellomorea aquimaris]